MKENRDTIKYIAAVVAGIALGAGAMLFFEGRDATSDEYIAEYYKTENEVVVSPHSLRTKMTKGHTDSYVLVDLRSQEEYEKAHIVTAINIPAYKDPNTSAYGDVERITNAFKEVIEQNPDKDIIVYCYSAACMTGRKIGNMLAEQEIYVKHLGIGWSEWRYYWNLWNHDGETPVTPEEYIHSGTEPGVVESVSATSSTCGTGDFGC